VHHIPGPPRDDEAPIQTRALEYTLRPRSGGLQIRVTFTFRNLTRDTAYIMRCVDPEVRLQRLGEGGWESVGRTGSFACLGEPIVVSAGGEWQGRFFLSGAAPDCNCVPKFAEGQPEGTFRLALDGVVDGFDWETGRGGDALPLAQRVSNRFKIRLP